MKKTSGDTEEDQKKSDQREVQTLTNSYLMVDPNKLNGVLPRLYNFTDYNQFSRPTDDIDISTGLPAPSGAALPDPIINKHIQLPDGNATVTALGWAATGEQDSGLSRLGVNDYAYYVNGSLVTEWLSAEFRVNYLTAGQVAFPDTNKKITGNASFSWDDSSTFLKLTSTAGKQIRLAYDASNLEDITIDSAGRIAITPGLWKISQTYGTYIAATAITNYYSETAITIPASDQIDVFRVSNTLTIGANASFRFINYDITSLAGSSASSNCYAVIGQINNAGPGTTKALYGRVTALAGSVGDIIGGVFAATPAAGTNFAAGIQLSMDSTAKNADAGIWCMSQTYPASSGLNYGLLIDQSINIASAGLQMFAGGAGDFVVLKNSAGSANLYKVNVSGQVEIGTTFGLPFSTSITQTDTTINLNRYSNDTAAPTVRFEKMRAITGTVATAGDLVGTLDFNVRNSTPAWKSIASITAAVQDPTAASEDGVLLFYGTVASVSAEYLRLGDVTGAGVSGVVVNNSSNSMFFQVRGVTAASLFVISGGTDRISSTVTDASTTPIYNFIQSSTGDSAIRFSIGTTNSWAIGADNSDSDAYKVSWLGSGSAILGTNDYLRIGADGAFAIAQWLNVGTTTDAVAQGDIASGLTGANRIFWDQSVGLFLTTISNASTTPTEEYIQASTGDAMTRWTLSGGASYGAGIDNSDSDKWKLSYGATGNAALGTNDRLTVDTSGEVIVVQWLQVGTATDPATQGDFSAGLTGAARLFYDQSVPAEYHYGSAGTIVNQFSSVALTANVLNEQGADIDTRFEGDTDANLFFLDASTDRIGIGTAAPGVKADILSTAQQLRLSYDGSNSTDFQVLSTGGIIITPTGSLVLFDHNANNDYQFLVRNQSNTAAAQAYAEIRVAGSTAGDAFVIFDRDGSHSYSEGLDNSTTDYCISYGSAANARPGTNDAIRVSTTLNVKAGKPSLATTATDGFLYVPACAGTPTGVPTAVTGMVPVVVDSTNNRWYFYSGGAWRNAGP